MTTTGTRASTAMTEHRRLHVGAFLGLSVGAYALSLAGVTALQAGAEAAIADDRVPTEQAIAALALQHGSLEDDAHRAALAYERATQAYGRVGDSLADVETRLADLTTVIAAVDGAARALPAHAPLPQVTRTVTTTRVKAKPAPAHATTAASGG